MPYKIKKNYGRCTGSKNYAVVNENTGKIYGCHNSNSKAVRQMRALYMSESKQQNEDSEVVTNDESHEKSMYSMGNVNSFAEYEESKNMQSRIMDTQELFDVFGMLASNTLYSSENPVSDIKTLSEELNQRVSGIFSENDEYEEKDSLTSKISKGVQKTLERVGIKKKDETHDSSVLIWKDMVDGVEVYNWIARYSNNIRDRDNPPEIISESSHKEFVKAVDEGQTDLPELWLWHNPDWKIGKARWVAYDDSGFALAGGYFYEHANEFAEMLASLDKDKVLVSHGMPLESIERDETDPTIITRHRTVEISPLPASRAANVMTGFHTLSPQKENDMTIPTEKREELVNQWGLNDELLDDLEKRNQVDSETADEKNLDRKEKTEVESVDVDEKDSTEETVESVEAESKEEIEAVEPQAEQSDEETLTVDTITEAMKLALAPLSEQIETLEGRIKEIETRQERDQKDMSDMMTPAASMAARIAGGVIGTVHKNIDEDVIDGRTKLAKSKPEETKEAQDGASQYGFINSILNGE